MTMTLTGPDFGELRGGEKTVGMYFASEEQAQETVEAVSGALEELAAVQRKTSLASFPSVEKATSEAEAKDDDLASEAIAKVAVPIEVEPITGVSDFKHDTHVVFNVEKSRYEGLPDGWAHVNKQFGVELLKVPKVDGKRNFAEKIPTVLVMLEDTLNRLDGFSVTGIFRVAPDGEDCAAAKEAIDSGDPWEPFEDVHVVSTLIKQYFRDLPPVGLLNRLEDRNIERIAALTTSDDDIDTSIIPSILKEKLEAPYLSLCLWLLDLMADVVDNSEANKMTSKNMAIVFSPNLYSTHAQNPMAALTMAQKVADCTNALLEWRRSQRSDKNADDPATWG